MAKHQLDIASFLIIFSALSTFFFYPALSQPQASPSPAAPVTPAAPAPASGPLNVTAILEKNGQFSTFIRLLKSTQVGDQLINELNNSNQGMTIFAPTDDAFNSLKSGTLNSLTDSQKVSLVQFHIVPQFLTAAQFQTVSNPLRTQAGGADGQFPLNITTSGNQVNISTGVDETQLDNSLYSANSLAIYRVNKVLLPIAFFGTPSPAEAPAPAAAEKKGKRATDDSPSSSSSTSSDTPSDNSGALGGNHKVVSGVVVGAAITAAMWL
uniref:FAS1 domain-containing protein n=2 Tax=Nymphaea colorata TaxID=210225 RepID=A0A5K1AB02_9MAGN